MSTSIFLAKLIGPFFLIVGAAVALNARNFPAIAEEFLRSPALIFLSALMILPAGLAIVLTHNVWVANWPVIVTLLGWISVISGAVRLIAPQRVTAIGRRVHARRNLVYASAAIWIAIGAVLTFFGYVR